MLVPANDKDDVASPSEFISFFIVSSSLHESVIEAFEYDLGQNLFFDIKRINFLKNYQNYREHCRVSSSKAFELCE